MRTLLILFLIVAGSTPVEADGDRYVVNFDLTTLTVEGAAESSIGLQGVQLIEDEALHGKDLSQFEYFFTISGLNEREGKLTLEFYQYNSRRKTSDIVSEIAAEVDIVFGQPGRFRSENEQFGVDLAFSIDRLR